MIADVRGYTAFTQARGDEEAGRLAARFAACTRECVDAGGGTVLELRGDEALCVFDSPRQALRTAIALQRAYADATREDPSLPLLVGIGLDAGEAVAVEGGFRGGALNLAARLCSLAGPGEALAGDGVVLMAGQVEGSVTPTAAVFGSRVSATRCASVGSSSTSISRPCVRARLPARAGSRDRCSRL